MNKLCISGALTARRITIALLTILLSISATQSAFATTVWSMPFDPIIRLHPLTYGTDDYMLYLVTNDTPTASNIITGVYLDNITLGNMINPIDLLDVAPSTVRDISSDVFDYTADEGWVLPRDPPPNDTHFRARITSSLDYELDMDCIQTMCRFLVGGTIQGVDETDYIRLASLNATYELVASNSPIP